ncbi:homeobox protein meis2 [Anaeramoeba flamelloides]|uniref:Homeobox protein meis2 n=1 Tax=Anaeramoeba flamelloides TaxID=1746091 RepID=A0AAV8AGF3_9EUKA|nr:homeobox protein meis2 [Anaeramoeba flamelloides]
MTEGENDINFTNFQDLNINSFTNNCKPILDVFEESEEETKNYSVGWDDDLVSLHRVHDYTEIENSIDQLDHYYTDSVGFDDEDSEDLPFLSTSSVLDSVRSLGTFPNLKSKQLKDIETDTSVSLEISDLNSPSLTDYEYLNFQREKEKKKNKKIHKKKKYKNKTIIYSNSNSFSLRNSKTEINSSHISKINKTNTSFNNNSNSNTKINPNNFTTTNTNTNTNTNKQIDFNLNLKNNSKRNDPNTDQNQQTQIPNHNNRITIGQLQDYFLDFDLSLLKKVIEKGQLSELLSKEQEKEKEKEKEKEMKKEMGDKRRMVQTDRETQKKKISNHTELTNKQKNKPNEVQNQKNKRLMQQNKQIYNETIHFNKFQEELEPSQVLEIYIKDKYDRQKTQLNNFSSSLKVENKPERRDQQALRKMNLNYNYNLDLDSIRPIVLSNNQLSQMKTKKTTNKFEKRKRNHPASSSSSTSDSEPNNSTSQSNGKGSFYQGKREKVPNQNNDNYIDSNFHSNYVSPSITNSISRSNLRMRNSTRRPKAKPPKRNKRKKTRKIRSNEIDWQRKTWRFVFGRKKGVKILKKKRKKRQQRLNTPKHAKSIFEKWFLDHLDDPQGPYMDKETRTQLSQITAIPELQVQRWFGQRRRSQRLRWLKGEAPKPNWI